MNKVSESIFNGKRVTLPMADVQHIEKVFHTCDLESGQKKGDLMGFMVITKHTRWDMEADDWANNIWIGVEDAESFMDAWTFYRHEIEGGAVAFKEPEDE